MRRLILAAPVLTAIGSASALALTCPSLPTSAGDIQLTTNTVRPCSISVSGMNCFDPPDGLNASAYRHQITRLTSGATRPELVVVLPGSALNPANNSDIINAAAYAGYRTIGLAYSNGPDGKNQSDTCDACDDPSETGPGSLKDQCNESFIRAVLYGESLPPLGQASPTLCNPGGAVECNACHCVPCETGCTATCVDGNAPGTRNPWMSIHRADSIEQRLIDLLNYLITLEPTGGWDAFLDGTGPLATPIWSSIIVSGFSQGSGHAAYLAKDHLLKGVVTFAGPADPPNAKTDPTPAIASWIANGPHATPGDRRYGEIHVAEGLDFDKPANTLMAWNAFGIPGCAPYDVTRTSALRPWPHEGSEHRFWINYRYPIGCSAHNATGADGCHLNDPATPGIPRVFPLFLHMFCRAGE